MAPGPLSGSGNRLLELSDGGCPAHAREMVAPAGCLRRRALGLVRAAPRRLPLQLEPVAPSPSASRGSGGGTPRQALSASGLSASASSTAFSRLKLGDGSPCALGALLRTVEESSVLGRPCGVEVRLDLRGVGPLLRLAVRVKLLWLLSRQPEELGPAPRDAASSLLTSAMDLCDLLVGFARRFLERLESASCGCCSRRLHFCSSASRWDGWLGSTSACTLISCCGNEPPRRWRAGPSRCSRSRPTVPHCFTSRASAFLERRGAPVPNQRAVSTIERTTVGALLAQQSYRVGEWSAYQYAGSSAEAPTAGTKEHGGVHAPLEGMQHDESTAVYLRCPVFVRLIWMFSWTRPVTTFHRVGLLPFPGCPRLAAFWPRGDHAPT